MQGSTTNLVKDEGTLSAAYDYSDFGETEEITGNGLDNQICYTGGIYDESTELYYLNARYYDPATGRFISQDTYRGAVDDPGQWHLYAYCANNPINYVDPSGHARRKSYTRSQSYNTYFLLRAIEWSVVVISVYTGGVSFFVYKISRMFGLVGLLASAAGISITSQKSIFSRLKSGFYKAGTKPRKGCIVTFYSVFKFYFKYKY